MSTTTSSFCILFVLCFIGSADGQSQRLRDIIALDVTIDPAIELSDEDVAIYFVDWARHELRRLQDANIREPGSESVRVGALELALAPVTSALSQCESPSGREEFSVYMLRIRSILNDLDTAHAVVDVLGEKFWEDVSLERTRECFVNESKSLREDGGWSLVSMYQSPRFQDYLSISEQQAREIESKVKSHNSRFMTDVNRSLEQLEALQTEKYHQTLAVLDRAQRQKVESRIGDPVFWFGYSDRLHLFRLVLSDGLTTSISFGNTYSEIEAEIGKSVQEFNDTDFERVGIEERADPLVWYMLDNKKIWPELGLSDSQQATLNDEHKDEFMNHVIVRTEKENRFRHLLEGKAHYPKTLTDLLSDDQLERFSQVELQIRAGMAYVYDFGLLKPPTIEWLDLEYDQIDSIRRISDEFKEESSVLVDGLRDSYREGQNQLNRELESVLGNSQVVLFERLVSAKPDRPVRRD